MPRARCERHVHRHTLYIHYTYIYSCIHCCWHINRRDARAHGGTWHQQTRLVSWLETLIIIGKNVWNQRVQLAKKVRTHKRNGRIYEIALASPSLPERFCENGTRWTEQPLHAHTETWQNDFYFCENCFAAARKNWYFGLLEGFQRSLRGVGTTGACFGPTWNGTAATWAGSTGWGLIWWQSSRVSKWNTGSNIWNRSSIKPSCDFLACQKPRPILAMNCWRTSGGMQGRRGKRANGQPNTDPKNTVAGATVGCGWAQALGDFF